MSHPTPIPVAVVGVGRMGRHHARIYGAMEATELVAVVDADPERAHEAAEAHGAEAFTSVQDLLDAHPELQAASIAVPTRHHLAAAGPLLAAGIPCLVEKPLAPDREEAHRLNEQARARGTLLQVGHTERFNPAVRAVLDMNLVPRFLEVHRISPMSFRSLDVGVVMDMMIHDLDIVLHLVQSPLRDVQATGIPILSEHEDVANARLVFENGCVANLTGSRLALKTERKLRLFSEEAYVSLDYQRRTGLVIRLTDNAASLADLRRELAAGGDLSDVDYSNRVDVQELDMDEAAGDPLTRELESFLAAVQNGGPPAVDGRAGVAAIEAAERVVEAIAAHRWEGLGSRPTLL